MSQLLFGGLLFALGIASVVLRFPYLSEAAYPILWWGLLLVLDFINFKRWGSSMMRPNWKWFLGIVVPVSTLYWLYFEFVNFVFPQWGYHGITLGIYAQVALTILSFSTVIPAVVEIFWFLNGPIHRGSLATGAFRSSLLFAFLGFVFTIIPLVSPHFWINQLMWIAPFFIVLPYIDIKSIVPDWSMRSISRAVWRISATGLLSGIFWELLNFWAGGKWVYLILFRAPHIFEMPVWGYFGFIPFALSTIAVYLFALRHVTLRARSVIVLYALALIASLFFVLHLQ